MNSEYNKLKQKHTGIIIEGKDALKLSATYTEASIKALHATNSSNTNSAEREKWSNSIEFLFSCIALSVGLGNIWRFPFIALENGGGAFVIPYIIVLLLIGRPIYYMEVVIGQFASRGCIKAFNMVPIMKGIAYGQIYSTFLATTYYACIMGLTIKYLIVSFSEILPWTYCRPEWGSICLNTTQFNANASQHDVVKHISSAELFFNKAILNEKSSIDDGIGTPNWDLVWCLLLAWIIICIILIKGIRSSGKVSYFLALFPYVVMLILLWRALSLPGSLDGIKYFLTPQWEELINPRVWYAAITQMFFSLAICFGTLIMYASFNSFRKNIYNDVIIITTVDSFTSILAGCIIFGILGNLAYETNTTDLRNVVKGGTGLAFISYPEAIAKFKYLPQAFAILFFAMLLVLGIGSNIGMASCIITVIKDRFTYLPHWLLAVSLSIIGFALGIVYMTPGGQFILNLVDFFGCSFIALVLAIAELITVAWFYGVKQLCKDIEFMLNVKTGIYWRFCWAVITPGLMFLVLIYTIFNYEPLQYKGVEYPQLAYTCAWCIWAIGVGQLPFWAIYTVYKQPDTKWSEKLRRAIRPTALWGPADPKTFEEYKLNMNSKQTKQKRGFFARCHDNIFG